DKTLKNRESKLCRLIRRSAGALGGSPDGRDDVLDAGIALQLLDRALPTHPAHLVSAEWRTPRLVADGVYPDVAGLDLACRGVGGRQIVRPDTGGQAVVDGIRNLDRLFGV